MKEFKLELNKVLNDKKIYSTDYKKYLTIKFLYNEYKEFYSDRTIEEFVEIITDISSNCILK